VIELPNWDESLEVGFAKFDQQHRELIDEARRLCDNAATGRPWQELRDAVRCLEDSTRSHQEEEEWVMRWLGYPRLEEHVAEHRALIGQLDRVRLRMENLGGSAALALALGACLSAAVTHIALADRLVGIYANEHVLSG
jgi:hemerythrin-like metal-binding protein